MLVAVIPRNKLGEPCWKWLGSLEIQQDAGKTVAKGEVTGVEQRETDLTILRSNNNN